MASESQYFPEIWSLVVDYDPVDDTTPICIRQHKCHLVRFFFLNKEIKRKFFKKENEIWKGLEISRRILEEEKAG